jgi:hypothetical protein
VELKVLAELVAAFRSAIDDRAAQGERAVEIQNEMVQL